jgi:hypothetical protein
MIKKIWPVLFLILCSAVVFAQDSTVYQGKMGIADVADEDPGLFIVMIIVLIGFITAIFLGLVAISVLFVSTVALVTGGIISFSVIMGIYHKSLLTGFRYFIVTASTLLGGAAGFIGYALFILLRHFHFQIHYPIFLSIAGGMAGGLIGGLLALKFISRLYERLKPK